MKTTFNGKYTCKHLIKLLRIHILGVPKIFMAITKIVEISGKKCSMCKFIVRSCFNWNQHLFKVGLINFNLDLSFIILQTIFILNIAVDYIKYNNVVEII